jgi:hypothetical protein
VSSRGDVEQQVLAWLGSRQDGWRLQVVFEVLKRLVCLLSPLELVVVLEQLEEGQSLFSKSGDESVQSCHAASELLDVLDHLRCILGCNSIDLLWIFFDPAMADNEPE